MFHGVCVSQAGIVWESFRVPSGVIQGLFLGCSGIVSRSFSGSLRVRFFEPVSFSANAWIIRLEPEVYLMCWSCLLACHWPSAHARRCEVTGWMAECPPAPLLSPASLPQKMSGPPSQPRTPGLPQEAQGSSSGTGGRGSITGSNKSFLRHLLAPRQELRTHQ